MKKKQVLLGLAGGGLLVVGMLVGVIFGGNLRALAASNTPATQATQGNAASYCQVYTQKVASDLGVTTDQLKSANQDAAQTVINQLASDGKISATQKNDLTQALQNYANSPCAFTNVAAARKALRGQLSLVLVQARPAIEAAVAQALNLPAATLESDLKLGQTVAQLASAQKVSLSAVNTAYLNALKAQLAKGVSAGYITQAQSDKFYSNMQTQAQQGRYTLLGMGGHGAPGAAPSH